MIVGIMGQISAGRDNLIARLTYSPADLVYDRGAKADDPGKRLSLILAYGSGMNFFETLLHPDREELEMGERMIVSSAANLLQVGEFQLLQLAYREWFNEDLPEALVARLFSSYMLRDEVPHWARHYARLILSREQRGQLNDNDPTYHRYDNDYHTLVPKGVRQFCAAVALLAVFMVTAVLVAGMTVEQTDLAAASIFQREGTPRPSIKTPGLEAQTSQRLPDNRDLTPTATDRHDAGCQGRRQCLACGHV